ncbi:GrpB family protein [Variovorax saccharolyticus]|uniref:GrpB family protein n=1 Tax=Variovorax saccharolyticus TaxID=3053516 RepID=UPI0025759675|nr:GrpB family protein [Variovorax sp. J22R187]MDM0019846.1 GrpB family protein [Variovorax sp. J22R187]
MKIERFDEGLEHRHIVPYDPVYAEVFLALRGHAQACLEGVELVHIGSTAVPELRGKPMIDIAAITSRASLREEQQAFERAGFHRRPVWVDKDDKPYVCASVLHRGRRFNINLHICHEGDPVHKDSLAFIDILNRRPDLRRKYERAKDRAHAIDPADPQVYNREKEAVIKEIEALIPGLLPPAA